MSSEAADLTVTTHKRNNPAQYWVFFTKEDWASIMASATPRLPLEHAMALQYRRQGACEDSDVMLRGHK
jgi:hypothetical protein